MSEAGTCRASLVPEPSTSQPAVAAVRRHGLLLVTFEAQPPVGSTLERDASSYFAMTLNAVVVWFKFTLPPVNRHITTIKVAVHLSDHSFDMVAILASSQF